MGKDFGALLYQSRTNKSASIKKRLKTAILVAVALIGFGLFSTLVLPHETFKDALVGYGALALGVIAAILPFVLPVSSNEVDIFENGLKLKAKIGARDVHYSEFLGICDSVQRHSENPKNARDFQVEIKGEKKNALFDYLNGLHDFGVVADTITDAYTAYLVNNLTKDNIDQADIQFSDQVCGYEFRLQNGKFMLKNKKGTQEIVAQDITSVRIAPGVLDMIYMADGKEKSWQRLQIIDMLNIRALYYIVHSILQS